jgi:hypothetical protein
MRTIFGKFLPLALLSAAVAMAQSASTQNITSAAAVAVPEPGTNMLIGGALLGLAVAFRKRAKG